MPKTIERFKQVGDVIINKDNKKSVINLLPIHLKGNVPFTIFDEVCPLYKKLETSQKYKSLEEIKEYRIMAFNGTPESCHILVVAYNRVTYKYELVYMKKHMSYMDVLIKIAKIIRFIKQDRLTSKT